MIDSREPAVGRLRGERFESIGPLDPRNVTDSSSAHFG
jgi:hypothetical protein